jgi:serine/threonine protein kinase
MQSEYHNYFIFLLGNPTPEQLDEFQSEIATMKRVGKHPNIVRLMGACILDKSQIMIMEYVPCGDLVCFHFYSRLKTF